MKGSNLAYAHYKNQRRKPSAPFDCFACQLTVHMDRSRKLPEFHTKGNIDGKELLGTFIGIRYPIGGPFKIVIFTGVPYDDDGDVVLNSVTCSQHGLVLTLNAGGDGDSDSLVLAEPKILIDIQSCTSKYRDVDDYVKMVKTIRDRLKKKSIKNTENPQFDKLLYTAQHNLGLVYIAEKNMAQAYEYVHQARLGFSRLHGEYDPLVLKARHNEALCKQEDGKYAEAIKLYTPLLEDRQKALGAEHCDTLKTALNLGLLLYQNGQDLEAESLSRTTMRSLERVHGRQHTITLCCMMNLALTLSRIEPGSEEALQLAREATDNRLLLWGADAQDTLDSWRDLALVLKAAGNSDAAEESLRRALNGCQKTLGFDNPKTRQILEHLCGLLDEQGKSKSSQDLRRECRANIVTSSEEAATPCEKGPIIAFILNIFILPDYRRCGFGKALLEHWKTLSRDASAVSLHLLAAPTSESIAFFCDTCGMSKVCERTLQGRSTVYSFLQCTL